MQAEWGGGGAPSSSPLAPGTPPHSVQSYIKCSILFVCSPSSLFFGPSSLCQYLVSEADFQEAEAAVAEFGKPGGVGEMLQNKLQQRAEVKESWVSRGAGDKVGERCVHYSYCSYIIEFIMC